MAGSCFVARDVVFNSLGLGDGSGYGSSSGSASGSGFDSMSVYSKSITEGHFVLGENVNTIALADFMVILAALAIFVLPFISLFVFLPRSRLCGIVNSNVEKTENTKKTENTEKTEKTKTKTIRMVADVVVVLVVLIVTASIFMTAFTVNGGMTDFCNQQTWHHREMTVYTDAVVTSTQCFPTNCTCDYVKHLESCSKLSSSARCDGGEMCCEYDEGGRCTKVTTNALCIRECNQTSYRHMILVYDNTCYIFDRISYPKGVNIYENSQILKVYQNPRDVSQVYTKFNTSRIALYFAGLAMSCVGIVIWLLEWLVVSANNSVNRLFLMFSSKKSKKTQELLEGLQDADFGTRSVDIYNI